jgi:hypothetical protein
MDREVAAAFADLPMQFLDLARKRRRVNLNPA